MFGDEERATSTELESDGIHHENRLSLLYTEDDTKIVHETYRTYVFAAIALLISLVTFTVQTETAQYIQKTLRWHKPFTMLYVTHSSWIIMAPLQFIVLRLFSPTTLTTKEFYHVHVAAMSAMARHILSGQQLSGSLSLWKYLVMTFGGVTSILTLAGITWYLAISLSSTSDVTALYNCSVFFAYLFSIPLLSEKFRLDKMSAVFMSMLGVFMMAYGDAYSSGQEDALGVNSRLTGNVLMALGAVLFGLYEVLFKKFACSHTIISPGLAMQWSNIATSCIGFVTLSSVWILLLFLHCTGLETIEMPSVKATAVLVVSVLCNVLFTASFLTMITLTSPLLSSVGAMLTIFAVAIVDWVKGTPFALVPLLGGLLIVGAFLLLTYASWREHFT